MKYSANVFLHTDSLGKSAPAFEFYATEYAAVEALAMWLEDGESPGDYLHTIIHDGDDQVRCLDFMKDALNTALRWREDRRMRA